METLTDNTAKSEVKPLYWLDEDGQMNMNFHKGQWKAWNSSKRIIMVLSGSQSGKTSWGPFWLFREIQLRGPGDYLVVAPTFKLLSLKLFPEFLRLFKTYSKLGDFTGRGSFQSRFLFSPQGCKMMFGYVPKESTQIFFGHAQDPDSLESATAKGIWLDEAGQKKFRLGSWEAVQRRGSIHRARILLTSTPYQIGWMKDLIYDPWRKAKQLGKDHPTIDVIQFKSIENPLFPREEYERVKLILPAWKFKMFYDGEFERPAGAIYDCFDKDRHVCEPYVIPESWSKRYIGLDFGGVHTAGVYLSEIQNTEGIGTGKFVCYREYPTNGNWGSMTSKNHVGKILAGEKIIPKAVGGAGSEDQWRKEFGVGGLYVSEPPIKEVEVGIDRVYGMIKEDRLVIFNTCTGLIDQVQSYSREVDDQGNPLDTIEDKDSYHYADALRYICSYLNGTKKEFWIR